MQTKHPLLQAIELRERAIKAKAHPLILKRIERLIGEESKKSLSILKKSTLLVEDSLSSSKELYLNQK